jgi:hypothetical protein
VTETGAGQTVLLVDGENIDATLGGIALPRVRVVPIERFDPWMLLP